MRNFGEERVSYQVLSVKFAAIWTTRSMQHLGNDADHMNKKKQARLKSLIMMTRSNFHIKPCLTSKLIHPPLTQQCIQLGHRSISIDKPALFTSLLVSYRLSQQIISRAACVRVCGLQFLKPCRAH